VTTDERIERISKNVAILDAKLAARVNDNRLASLAAKIEALASRSVDLDRQHNHDYDHDRRIEALLKMSEGNRARLAAMSGRKEHRFLAFLKRLLRK
jgi:hypothetical protein